MLDFRRIYRSSLYASGKTESTLFNTLTEKKSQYTKFLHRLYVYEE